MSGSSYLLEAPRARPSPLQFEDSSYRSSSRLSLSSRHQSPPPLLYDLPSNISVSPPTSPKSSRRLISPTSPSFPGRSPTPRSGRPTPPPSRGARNRSTTPSGVAQGDLEKFAEHCRAWYFSQDDNSGRLMTQTLATLPPSQRAPYTRLQSSIRSAFHRSVNARRTAEFRAHLSATQPGGSLMPHSRANPHGSAAKKERYERFERFIRSWCTMGMPGPQPFFQALWAVMRLQVVPENIGGAGGNRVDWEIDDAVFKEAAGKDFMLEAIDVLKGVLAFEELSSSKGSPTPTSDDGLSLRVIHSRSQSQPLPSNLEPVPITAVVKPKRGRAPSDPFLDTPVLSRSVASSSSQSTGSALLSAMNADAMDDFPSPATSAFADDASSSRANLLFDDSNDDEEYLRIWTSPDLPNPEYLDLVELFPSFITRRPLPRFPIPNATLKSDLEEGFGDGPDSMRIRFGTGSMWVSSKQRSDGWEGGIWTRFILWWRKIFC